MCFSTCQQGRRRRAGEPRSGRGGATDAGWPHALTRALHSLLGCFLWHLLATLVISTRRRSGASPAKLFRLARLLSPVTLVRRCASRFDPQRHVQPWVYGIYSVQCCLASPSASVNHEAAVPTRTCSSFPSRCLRFNGSPSPSVRQGPYTWLHHGIRRSGHQLDSA